MLTISAINPTGMFSFGWMPIIQLDRKGRILISGRNGTGKSSILNSIKEIAFGKNDTNKSGANVINKHEEWVSGMFGVLWCIDRNSQVWRIMNVRNWKSDSCPEGVDGPSQLLALGGKYTDSDVFIELWDDNQWVDMRPTASKNNKSLRDAQQFIIDNIFCMTYDQFSSYVCLGQKAESALVMGTSGAREKVIQAVADVSIWTDAADIAKNAYTNKEAELDTINSDINGRQASLEYIVLPTEQDLQEAAKAVQLAENNYHQLCQSQIEIQKQIDELKLLLPDIEGIDQELQVLDAEGRHSKERYDNFLRPIKPESIEKNHTKILELQALNRVDLTKSKHYRTLGEGQCSNCGQKVTKKRLKVEIDELSDSMANRELKVDALYEDLEILRKNYEVEVEKVEEAAKEKYNEEIHYLETAKLFKLAKKKEYESTNSSIEHLEEKYDHSVGEIDRSSSAINIAKSHLATLQGKVQEVEQIKSSIKTLQDQANYLVSEIIHLKWTERNLKKLRIQEYEAAIDRLNQLIADRLYELWGPGLFARFVTARSATRGKGVISGLEFIVDTTRKVGIPIEMYSGGERKIIIVATFLAMIQLSQERGLGVNITGIDELDEHLDDVNTDKLVEAFESIAGAVPTCLIISHNTRLLNTMNFDEKWTMIKEDEMATLQIDEAMMAA